MKKLAYYAGLMIAIVVILPLFIVKSCGHPQENKPPEERQAAGDLKIKVYNAAANKTTVMNLEEYIKGVVAAEMPADFDIEALKAQAVAARTFAYGRLTGAYRSAPGLHDEADICTDPTHCQAWIAKADAMKKWKLFFAARNWAKIEKAVNSTRGMIVVYKGNIANTLFHASSSGRTENSEDVWPGVAVPYLRSVESGGEEDSKGYVTTVSISNKEFLHKLREKYPDHKISESVIKNIKVLDYTEGGRVNRVRIGDVTMRGTEFRTLFKLRSADFSIKADRDGKIEITTTGYGHGVGMSQWGADSLAKKGATYAEILRHYYTGVDIISIPDYESK